MDVKHKVSLPSLHRLHRRWPANFEMHLPNYDVNITIVNANGQPVWQRDFTAPETSFVSISLDSLPQGSYTIEISNDYGGYLQGIFQL